MESITRALAVYVFLQVLMRVSGRRTLGEMTPFDLVLLLIISEATQQALLSDDYSILNAFIVITAMVLADIGLSYLKRFSPAVEKWVDGMPTILVADGKVLKDKLKACRIGEEDVLESARKSQGIGKMSEIKHAILEKSGDISIIPR